jgi:hypothetical protein
VRKVKTLIDRCPHFTRQALKYAHLLEITRDTTNVKRNERFIRYSPTRQTWCVYTQSNDPQIYGRYNNVMSAVFHALK